MSAHIFTRRASAAAIALASSAALTPAIAQMSPATQAVAITGGRVFPVSGSPIDTGTVLIRGGKIVAVGANVAVPADARRVDATGKWVTPGLVNAATQLGLVEVGAVAQTREASANGRDNIAAAFTVWDGLNPASVNIRSTRSEGVTSAVILPTGGLISGQGAFLTLVDGSAADMIARSPVAMVADVGDAQRAGVASRGELLVKLREVLEDARAYGRRRAEFERNDTRPFAASRLDLEALQPVLAGRMPMLVVVDKASDIESALNLSKKYGLRLMIVGGAEAWLVADKLAVAKVPVITGAMNNIPGNFSSLGQRQENAALLRKAGVTVALTGNAGGGDEEAFNVRNIKQEAGNAVSYGMSWDDALRAVTIVPAEMFGVADRVGALQAGRDADVVVWSGDPFELSTRAEHVFVRGNEFLEPSRQDELMQRYRRLPPAYVKP